jgi:hypothetical protein
MKNAAASPRVVGPFKNDDEYLAWVRAHPSAFVLTSNKSLTPRHTVIHRATCPKILVLTGNAATGGFTRKYIKVGAESISSLRGWVARERDDASARECSVCSRGNSV